MPPTGQRRKLKLGGVESCPRSHGETVRPGTQSRPPASEAPEQWPTSLCWERPTDWMVWGLGDEDIQEEWGSDLRDR